MSKKSKRLPHKKMWNRTFKSREYRPFIPRDNAYFKNKDISSTTTFDNLLKYNGNKPNFITEIVENDINGIGRSRGIGGFKPMRGGMVSSPASGPVGSPWQGGNYVTPTPNFFAYSPNGIAVGGAELARSTTDDFIIKPPMNGGKKRNNKVQRGGFFQEILNLGRGAQYGINGGYFGLTGKQQPLSQNPYPSVQPIGESTDIGGQLPSAPDMKQIYINANNQVGKI